MFKSFFEEKAGPLVLRLAIGLACVYHGFLKIQADGGTTWAPGLATHWQLALAWGQFGAGIAILLGFFTRFASGVVIAVTLGTLALYEGWNVFRLPVRTLEPYVMFVLICSALLFVGAGTVSLDGRSGGSKSSGQASRKKAAA